MSSQYAVLRVWGRYRGVCRCGWSTADTYYPRHAESRVRDHVRDVHGITP